MYIAVDNNIDSKLFPDFSFILTSNLGQVITKPFNTKTSNAYALVICDPYDDKQFNNQSWVYFFVNNQADKTYTRVEQMISTFDIKSVTGKSIFGAPLITGAFNYTRLMIVSLNHKREFKMIFTAQKDVNPMPDYNTWPKDVQKFKNYCMDKTAKGFKDAGGMAHIITPKCLLTNDCYSNNYPPGKKPDPPKPDPDDDTIFGMSKTLFIILCIGLVIIVISYKNDHPI
jgi:hypothetical protein